MIVEVWFLIGSQHLYGLDVLCMVEVQVGWIVVGFDGLDVILIWVIVWLVLTIVDAIRWVCFDVNVDDVCIGVIIWMYMFLLVKMWIVGLFGLQKPLLYLYIQYNVVLLWVEIDMDFMNLNQLVYGDCEFGYLVICLWRCCKIVVGYWEDVEVQWCIGVWMCVVFGWQEV